MKGERNNHPNPERNHEQTSFSSEDAAWARMLSDAARLNERDTHATDAVLKALRAERSGLTPITQTDWDRALSRASQLREIDHQAVRPALEAVRVERFRAKHRRVVLNRAFAGFAAAAVIAGVLIVRTPNNPSADPGDAYAVYQEASQGW